MENFSNRVLNASDKLLYQGNSVGYRRYVDDILTLPVPILDEEKKLR